MPKMSVENLDDLLDVHAVAKRLRVVKDTVYRWSRKGLLPAIHLPGPTLRWDPNDVDKLLKQLTSGKL